MAASRACTSASMLLPSIDAGMLVSMRAGAAGATAWGAGAASDAAPNGRCDRCRAAGNPRPWGCGALGGLGTSEDVRSRMSPSTGGVGGTPLGAAALGSPGRAPLAMPSTWLTPAGAGLLRPPGTRVTDAAGRAAWAVAAAPVFPVPAPRPPGRGSSAASRSACVITSGDAPLPGASSCSDGRREPVAAEAVPDATPPAARLLVTRRATAAGVSSPLRKRCCCASSSSSSASPVAGAVISPFGCVIRHALSACTRNALFTCVTRQANAQMKSWGGAGVPIASVAALHTPGVLRSGCLRCRRRRLRGRSSSWGLLWPAASRVAPTTCTRSERLAS